MSEILKITKGELKRTDVFWATEYGCPVYKVGDKFYVEQTGEYSGYFDEAIIEVTTPKSAK